MGYSSYDPSYKTTAMQYPDGSFVIDPNTGDPFPSAGIDMMANIRAGQRMGEMGGTGLTYGIFASQVATGSSMDYQRPDGLIASFRGSFQINYTNVTAYNFGVVSAAAGIPLSNALSAAGSYNLVFGNPSNANTSYGLAAGRVVNIVQGYNDYQGGRWGSRK
jgi:hypothetical protein